MSIGTRLRPSTSSLKVPPWQGANAPVTQVGNMNPSPRGHGNCTTRTLGTTATLTHSPATLTETGPSITWHRLQDQARIGFLTRRSLRHRPHTLCEEDRRKGGNRRRGCEKGWQWKLRQHLIAPVPQGLKGRGLKQDRHRAPAPWGWWGLGGRGPRRARGGNPGSSGGGGQTASVGSEAPSQGLPQGQRDSLALGRVCSPHTRSGQ